MTVALEGVSGQQHAPTALYPLERPGTHFTGGWVSPKAGLDWRKISSAPGFDPGSSSPYSVAIPTELPGPLPSWVRWVEVTNVSIDRTPVAQLTTLVANIYV